MEKSPLYRWVIANKDKEGFSDSLLKLLSYACSDWIYRETSIHLTSGEGLSYFLLKGKQFYNLEKWIETPEKYVLEIIDFCENSKKNKLPFVYEEKFPTKLDLRGVHCPYASVKARLVMEACPKDVVFEIDLDKGSPIENVPQALVYDGVKILSREKREDYWVLKVVKPLNKE